MTQPKLTKLELRIMEVLWTRGNAAQQKLIDDLLALFGGRAQPVMAHLIESGRLTLEDIKEAEKTLRTLERRTSRDDPAVLFRALG